jgi:hypothetical protein
MTDNPVNAERGAFASIADALAFMDVAPSLSAHGGEELRAWVKAHPGLLDPLLDQTFETVLQDVKNAEETRQAAMLGVYVQLREDCRDYGVDAAFDHFAWEAEEAAAADALRRIRSEALNAEKAYSRTRSVQALENAARIWDRAEKAAADANAPWLVRTDFAAFRSIAYLKRYRVMHRRADSDGAIATLDALGSQLPLASGLRLTCLINAGIGWRDQASHEQSREALDQAIQRFAQVVNDYQSTGRTDTQVVDAFGDLCRCLFMRYHLTGSTEDLREAGRAHEAWLAFKPKIDPREADWQAELTAELARQGTSS